MKFERKRKAKLKKTSDAPSHAPFHATTQAAHAEAFYQEYFCIVNHLSTNSLFFFLLILSVYCREQTTPWNNLRKQGLKFDSLNKQ